MPIYKDCTLGEMLFVGGCALFLLGTILSLITKFLLGFAWIGLTLAILSLVHVTRFLLGRLQKVKYGKPYGYYQQLFLRHLQKNSFLNSFLKLPFVQRHGKWSVRRMT
jgi:conjugative transfer region protein (TIGR03750 family)